MADTLCTMEIPAFAEDVGDLRLAQPGSGRTRASGAFVFRPRGSGAGRRCWRIRRGAEVARS